MWRVGCSPFGGDVRLVAFGQKRVTQSIPVPTLDLTSDVVLEVTGGNSNRTFVVPGQSLSLLESGKRIIAQNYQYPSGRASEASGSERRLKGILSREEGKGLVCSLIGSNTRLHVRPIRINGVAKFLIYYPVPKNDKTKQPSLGERK